MNGSGERPSVSGVGRRMLSRFQPMCGTLNSRGTSNFAHFAREDAEPFEAAPFVAGFEQQLQAQADAEQRFPVADRLRGSAR